ncbi:5-guanidino-2-oxopentanoate decarboxylase [Sulfitobacter aestuariivivens]
MLKDRGVDVIFGIPGVHNQEMYRGIEEAGIAHVLARHEQGAGFMADGYARATGRPGVAYVITGPGVCNIMTPMGQAYSDSVPMLVISSCLDETAATRGQLHQMKDQQTAAGTVCDWSEEARTADAAYQLVDRAFAEFSTERPRSKHLQVPISVLEAQADTPPKPLAPAPPLTFSAGDVAQVAALLAEAKRPLFIFGGGAANAADPARLVLKTTGAASFTTYAGRGIVGPDNPLAFGSYLAKPDSMTAIQNADLIIAVGTELAQVDIWRDALGNSGPLVRIDLETAVLADGQRCDHPIQAEAGAFLAALAETLPGTSPATDWNAEEIARSRARWAAEVDAEYPGIPTICDALKACLPDGTMIYSDMTQFAYAAKEVWDMDRPGHWHHPYGFGTLGYALPAAIGGAVGRPGLPTMAIAGDYGFHYTMQELGVAVELGLSLPIILWDNGKLGAIEASMVSAQIAPNAVVARNPDFVKLAQAFGAGATAPQTLEEMQSAVHDAFKADGPTLIYITPEILG